MPVKDEHELLRHSLPSCYNLNPDEVLLCFDDPPHNPTVREVERIASYMNKTSSTRIITIPKNPEYRFNQAWVRRQGFREARNDRILTTDADIVLTKKALRAISIAGRDDIGLASCTTLHCIRGVLGVWKAVAHRLADLASSAGIMGLYALWRPYWRDSEDESIKQLPDPRKEKVIGSRGIISEDVYLRDRMREKHVCVHLKQVGGYNMRPDWPDQPNVQLELGRFYAESGYSICSTLARSIIFARPHLFRGYLYQKTHVRCPDKVLKCPDRLMEWAS
jgi:glycosyltransferase involved in cell wall biosynthesis